MVENNQTANSNSQNTTTNSNQNVAANTNETVNSGAAVNQGFQGVGQQQPNINVGLQGGGYQQTGYYQPGYQQQGFAQNQFAPNYQQNYQQGLGQQGLQQGIQGIQNPQLNNQLNVPYINTPENQVQGQEDIMTSDQRTRYNEMLQKVSAKKMTDLAPALDTYIKADLEEKAILNNQNAILYQENQKLKGELQRLANITLLSKHQFNTHDYDIVLKLCDYVVTEDKLVDIAKDWRFQNLRNKRAEQQRALRPNEEAAGLFDDIMGIKRT